MPLPRLLGVELHRSVDEQLGEGLRIDPLEPRPILGYTRAVGRVGELGREPVGILDRGQVPIGSVPNADELVARRTWLEAGDLPFDAADLGVGDRFAGSLVLHAGDVSEP